MGVFIKWRYQTSFAREIYEIISSRVEDAAVHRCWGCRKVWTADEVGSRCFAIEINYSPAVALKGSPNGDENEYAAVITLENFGCCSDSPFCEKESKQAFMLYKKDQGCAHFDPETYARDPSWVQG